MAEKKCNNCGDKSKPTNVTYAVFESTMTRQHIILKRLIAVIILLIVLLVGSNCAWLYAWTQYDYESYEITADGDSNANYIGQDGNIYNGGFNQGEETETKK